MTLSVRSRTLLVLASAAALTLSTASVATGAQPHTAQPDTAQPDTESQSGDDEVPWPPADTGGHWLPVPEQLTAPFDVEGCGSVLHVSPGDVDETEYSAMVQPDGTVRVEYRGASTADLVRESDGATLDELDISGPGHEIYAADGRTVTYSFDGASYFFAFDDVEAAVLATEGLPPIFYYESGNLTERVTFPADPNATTVESAQVLTDTMRGVSDVCDLLDDAAAHGH